MEQINHSQTVKEPCCFCAKKPHLMILGAFLLVFLSSSVTYLIVKSQLINQSSVGSSTPIVKISPTPSTIADPTVGWKTYSNDFYGYSLKYPFAWSFQETTEAQGSYVRFQKGEFTKGAPTSETYISINKQKNEKRLPLLKWLIENEIVPKDYNPAIPEQYEIASSDVTVAGIIAKQFISARDGGKTIYILHGDSVFQISNILMGDDIEEAKTTFDQILSTFKFN